MKNPSRHISQQTNLDKRTVRKCVRRLIIKHKIPIIGNRKGNHKGYFIPGNHKGYFIPANHSELMAGIGVLEKQIEEEKKRLEILLEAEV